MIYFCISRIMTLLF